MWLGSEWGLDCCDRNEGFGNAGMKPVVVLLCYDSGWWNVFDGIDIKGKWEMHRHTHACIYL